MPRSGTGPSLPEITAKLSADELVKRLKACLKFLLDCESLSETASDPVTGVASALVQPFIQRHKSKDVRLLAACCIAEVFRVCFPDPHYNEEELRSVFSLFVSQLQGLEKPSSPAFKWSFQLLESIASMKSFNLCLTLEAQDILADLFRMVFSIINADQSSKVRLYLLEVLTGLVQEGESLSQEIMDTILVNIVEPHKSENKVAYMFAVEFIKRASSYLEPYIQMFFTNALVVGKSSESEVGEHLYDLILELHAIDPSVLLSVMPQLEFKLKTTDTDERLQVTRLLAGMFSPRDSRLAITNKSLWLCFLSRFSDVSPNIRIECVKYSKYFLVYHPHLAEDTAGKLHERWYDREDKVRLEVVRAVCEAAADNMQAVPQMLFEDLQQRMRDKVWAIRKEAVSNIARLYRQVMSSSFSSGVSLDASAAQRVSWMPNKILHSYYQNINEDRLCVERCLLSCLVPVSLKDEEKVERLRHVYTSLDDHATRAFEFLLKNREQLRTHVLDLIQISQNEEMEDERKKQLVLTKVIQIARCLPEAVKSQGHLQELVVMLEDDQLREALGRAMDCSAPCQEVMKAKSEVVTKVGSRHGILDSVRDLLDRGCPMLVDSHCVALLVEGVCSELSEPALSQSEEEEREAFARNKKAVSLIKALAGVTPSYFSSAEVFESLIGLLRHEDGEIVCSTLQILIMTGKYIDKTVAGCLQPILTQLAQKGAPELAKHTVRCISAVFLQPKPILQRLYNALTSNLNLDHAHLPTVLLSLCEVAQLQPALFEAKHKIIIRDFVVKKLLVVDRAQGEFVEGAPEWCEDESVSAEARSKVLGIKLLVGWLLGLRAEQEKASQPVLRLLDTLLAHDGDLQGEDNISAPDRSRLRLAAACGLLKLARCSHYCEVFSLEQLQRLALTMQDTCEQVRDRFAHKLNKGLRLIKLPLSFLAIFALAGIEPRKEARTKFHQMVAANVEKRRECLKQHSKAKEHPHMILPEYALSHALHLLAHHPDFSRTNPQALDNFKDCLWFFLEPVVHKSENYGFLHKLLESIKQMTDAQDPGNTEANKNLYAVCDLALGVLTKKLTHIKIGDFPGKVALPGRLFKARPKNAPANEMRYLPPNYDCTPTKRDGPLMSTPFAAAGDEMDTTLSKKGRSPADKSSKTKTPKKGKSPKAETPKGKSPKAETPKGKSPKAETPKGKSPKTETPKGRTPKTRTPHKKAAAKSPGKKSKTEESREMDDSGVSDVEDQAERQQEEGEGEGKEASATPSRAKKRSRVTTQPAARKRNVRRKVLQESQESQEKESSVGDHTEEDMEQSSPNKEAVKSKGAQKSPAKKRNVKRKVLQEEVHNGVNHPTSESQDQSEVETAPSPKKRKTKADAGEEASISVKRKSRRRK